MRQKLFTKEIDNKLFSQYKFGNDLKNQMVVAKIFNPYGSGTFYLLNSDPSDPDYIWAIVDLFEIEVGSVSRESLEMMKVPPFGLNLERDIYFQPINASELLSRLNQGETFAKGGKVNGYKIYHDTLAQALEEVEDFFHNEGYLFTSDNYFPDVTVGGIGYGETVRISRPIQLQGKSKGGVANIQIYRMDSGRYELNMYPSYANGGMFAEGGGINLGDVVEVKEPNYGRDDSYYVVSNKAGYDEKSFQISPTSARVQGVFEEEQLRKLYANGGVLRNDYFKIKEVDKEGNTYYTYLVKNIASPTPPNAIEISKEEYDMANKFGNGGGIGSVDERMAKTIGQKYKIKIDYKDSGEVEYIVYRVSDGKELKSFNNGGEAKTFAKNLEQDKLADGGELQIIKNESGENYLANVGSTPNEMAIKLANGGGIPNNYRGRATEDIWNSLTENQRVHFMIDHFDELGVKENEIVGIANKEFKDLNEDVQNAFGTHKMMGQYANGGETNLSRDRMFKSQQIWEQNYQRKTRPKNPHYKKFEDGGKLSNYDRGVVREDMEKFVSIAKTSKDGKEFIDKARKITNVNPTTSSWFFERYDDLDMNKASDKFVKEVKDGTFDVEKIYANGGKIKNQYEGRTPEDIWNNLSKEQRSHFIYDHAEEIEEYRGEEFGELSSKEIIKAYNSDYKDLDKNIRNRFDNHTREGQYRLGGEIKVVEGDMIKSKNVKGKVYYASGTMFKLEDEYGNKNPKYFSTKDFKKSEIIKMAKGGMTDFPSISERKNKTYYHIIWDDGKKVNDLVFDSKSEAEEKYDSLEKQSGIKAIHLSKETFSKYGHLEKHDTYKMFPKFGKGGTTTFNDKVKSIAKNLLKKKKVSPKVQKDYGKTYNKKEAVESAKRIVGAMRSKMKMSKGGRLNSMEKKLLSSIQNSPTESMTDINLSHEVKMGLNSLYLDGYIDKKYIKGSQDAKYTLIKKKS